MADTDKPKSPKTIATAVKKPWAKVPEGWPPLIGLTVDEAAAALRTDDKTIRKLIQAGEIPARIVGRGYRIDPDAIRAWMASGHDGQIVPGQDGAGQ